MEQHVLRFGHTRASVLSALGAPNKLEVVGGEAPAGGIDTLIYFHYPGLEIVLRKVGTDQQEYFSNIRALDTTFTLPSGLRLFTTTRRDVARLFGAPPNKYVRGDTTVLSYEAPQGPVIQLYMLADVLVRVRWVYELG